MQTPTSAGNQLRVSIVNPLQYQDWDTQTTKLSGSTIFHRTAWAQVLNRTYGFTPLYFACYAGSQLRGLVPMMEIKSWLSGSRGVSLPFTDFCEPLCADQATFDRIRQEIEVYAQDRRWKYWEIRGGRQLLGATAASVAYYEHTLALNRSERELNDGLDSSSRRAVRKAEKSGVVVAIDNTPVAIATYYQLHCQTRKRQGHPPQPFHFFERIQADILAQGQGWVFIARKDGVPVAANVFFHDGATVIYRFGASDVRHQELRANNLLMWTAIRWYRDQGARRLHFGRTSLDNEGLRRFKMSWGSEENTISYFRIAAESGQSLSVRDEASGFHTRIFRILPQALARRLGSALYRHIG